MCWVQGEANLRICRFCRHDLVLAGTLTLIRGLLLSRVQPSLWRHALGYVFCSGLVFKCNSHPFGVWFQSSMVIGLNWSNEQDLILQHISTIFGLRNYMHFLRLIDFWTFTFSRLQLKVWHENCMGRPTGAIGLMMMRTVKNKTRRAPPEKPQRYST